MIFVKLLYFCMF